MESQLPFKQIELKNNKIFVIIVICSTIFSIFNFSVNYYLIKALNPNAYKNDILFGLSSLIFKNNVKLIKNLQTKVIDGSKFDQLKIKNENSVNLKSADGSNQFILGDKKIEIQTNDFRILSQDQKTGKRLDTFRLKDDELFVKNVDNIHIQKQGGLDISNSLETQSITGSFSNDLELNSLTKNIEINSKNSLSLNSKYSNMNLDSLKNLNLIGQKSIILGSKYVNIKKLNKNQITNKETENQKMFKQLCACKNGNLFAVPGNEQCKDDGTICN